MKQSEFKEENAYQMFSGTSYIVLWNILKDTWENEQGVKERFMEWFRDNSKQRAELLRENELLKASEQAAIQSQKKSFNEQQHIIDLQKGAIETTDANFKLFTEEYESKISEMDKQIQELKKENERLSEYNKVLKHALESTKGNTAPF